MSVIESTLEEVVDKDGVSVLLHRVEGILYPLLPHSSQNAKPHLNAVKAIQLRPDDVIVFGYPRSGNHWLHEIIHMLMHGSATFSPTNISLRMPSFLSHARREKLDSETSPRLLASHLRLQKFDKLPQSKPKVIYVIRNPKDVLVSLFNFYRAHNAIRYNGKWEHFLELALQGEVIFGSWFDHVLAVDKFKQEKADFPLHIICFEDMKKNPVVEIQHLAAFLEKPTDLKLAQSIAEKTAFGVMKEKIAALKMAKLEHSVMKKGYPGFLRKGSVGEWRQWFTTTQSKEVDKLFREKMTQSKIASLVQPYLQSSKL